MGTDGGLGEIKGLGRLGKAALAGHLYKHFQLFQLHDKPPIAFSSGMGYTVGTKSTGGDEMPYEKLRLTAMTTAGG